LVQYLFLERFNFPWWKKHVSFNYKWIKDLCQYYCFIFFLVQRWRKKAEEVKKTLGIVSPKAVSTPVPKVKDDSKAEPIDLAAHLQLLGESLGTIGACLRVQVRPFSVDCEGVGRCRLQS